MRLPALFNRVFLILAIPALALFLAPQAFGKARWQAVDKADLDAKECAAYPGVAAEDLFLIQAVDTDGSIDWYEYYLRRKVYNPKSAQEEGVLSIVYDSTHSVTNLAARVVKPNGQIIELGKKDFTDVVLAKYKGSKVKTKTLAFPNLEAGDIVEYQWLQDTKSEAYEPNYIWIQSEYPRRLFQFTLKGTRMDCQVLWFNTDKYTSAKEDGHQVLRVKDLPAYNSEPYMPPEHDVRAYMILMNTSYFMRWYGKEDLWRTLASELGENRRLECKPNEAIRTAAKNAMAGATTDREKIAKLYNHARTEITNLNYYANDKLAAVKKKLDDKDETTTASEVAKLKAGYSFQVNQYFASLCTAAGYEVIWDNSSSKNLTTKVQHAQGFIFLNSYLVGVKSSDGLLYYCPGDLFVTPGMIPSRFEQAPGLYLDEKGDKAQFVFPQVASPSDSIEKRVGNFTLTSEGDLEGTVTLTYTGHLAVSKKTDWFAKTNAEIEKSVREELAETLPTAEFSDFEFLNTDNFAEPTTVKYKMKLSGYAETAGERLVVSPSVFQKGAPTLFKASTRKYDIAFPYAWEVRDDVTLTIPEDMEVDTPSAPQSFGKADEPIRVRYKLSLQKKTHSINYSRSLVIGDHKVLSFPAAMYPALKQRFDLLLKADAHTLLLKPKDTAAPETAKDAAAPAEEKK